MQRLDFHKLYDVKRLRFINGTLARNSVVLVKFASLISINHIAALYVTINKCDS